MDHPEGHRGQDLDHEIAIADGIQRVGAGPVEAQLGGRRLAVERVAGAGQGARPERRHVEPAAGVGQPAAVALEHLDVGQQVVPEQDRLGRLDMGGPGQDGLALAFGQPDQGPLHRHDCRVQLGQGPARPEAQIGGHLVVA